MFCSRVGGYLKSVWNVSSVRQFHCTGLKYSGDENPVARTFRIIKNDIKAQVLKDSEGSQQNHEFPAHTDVVIIGGGAMGASIAYWLKDRTRQGLNVTVVERDPTYAQASSVLSVGGLRQQFSVPENIQMSLFGAEFLRNIKKHCGPDSDVSFNPFGYLLLANQEGAEQLQKNSVLQRELGAKNELLSGAQLRQRFPWLSVDDVELGCYGLENEGWFDPWTLLSLLKRRSIELGAQYLSGEACGFEFRDLEDVQMTSSHGVYRGLDSLQVRLPDGRVRPIKFAVCVVAAGAQSGSVAQLAGVGVGPGLLSVPLPVEPRKRFVYCFECGERGPGLDAPLTIDHSGVYFRRDGLGGRYIAGRAPQHLQEPPTDNLDVDHSFFDECVWPPLARRVPAFDALRVRSAWSGYYEFNTFDENGIVGPHPYYNNLYLATGFSGHGIQQAPAVGRAVAEMVLDGRFKTIDLTRLGFDRILLDRPIREHNCF